MTRLPGPQGAGSSPAFDRIVALLLLALGVQLWLTVARSHYGTTRQLTFAAAVLVIGLIPWVNRPVARWLARLRQRPSNRVLTLSAIAVALAASGYLLFTAWFQDRTFAPIFHDEHMLLIQAQMLARGRLWMPGHPLHAFFDTFHVFVQPVYAAMHFPGTAMLHVPGIWLGLPLWVMPLLIAGAAVGALYRVLAEVIDPVSGAVAATWAVSLTTFRAFTLVPRSQYALLLLALLMVWGWLRWRDEHKRRWELLIGALAGWCAITRPAEAICFAVPVGLAMVWTLSRQAKPARIAACFLRLIAGAAPFLALQVIFNVGVTGSPFRTPHQQYVDLNYPRAAYGFHETGGVQAPADTTPQKRRYYEEFVAPAARAHRPAEVPFQWARHRFPLMAAVALPVFFIVLLPLGLRGLRNDIRRWVLLLPLPLFVLAYSFSGLFVPEYVIPILPALTALVLLGVRETETLVPRWGQRISAVLTLVLVTLLIASLPEFNPLVRDDPPVMPVMDTVNRLLREQVQPPAIVLFNFGPDDNPHEEPVYNIDAAWPDDPPVIRAHDLGPQKNRELFLYYARRQPARRVYFFDRATGTLHFAGTVSALAADDG